MHKEKKKETQPGYKSNPFSEPRARTRTRKEQQERFNEAGLASLHLINVLGGSVERDFKTWAQYCYWYDIDAIYDVAYNMASSCRQGEIRNAVTAFQKWLQKNLKICWKK